MKKQRRDIKKHFYAISHLLHEDKISIFVENQNTNNNPKDWERLKYIKNLTSCYVQLSNIFNESKKHTIETKKEETIKSAYNILNKTVDSLDIRINKLKDLLKTGGDYKEKEVVSKPESQKHNISEPIIRYTNNKSITIVNILSDLKTFYKTRFEINPINQTIESVSKIKHLLGGKLLTEKEALNITRKWTKIENSYIRFSKQLNQDTDKVDVYNYIKHLIGIINIILYSSLSKNNNERVKTFVDNRSIKDQIKIIIYNKNFLENEDIKHILTKEEKEEISST